MLDVGCGTGADLIAIAERLGQGARATGIDVSESMIAEARRRASAHAWVATRLRAIEHAYNATAGHGTAFTPPEPARALRYPWFAADQEIELG